MIVAVTCQTPSLADVVVLRPVARATDDGAGSVCGVDVSGLLPASTEVACVCQARGTDRPACRAELTESDTETGLACIATWYRWGVAYEQRVTKHWKRVR